ncbi:hypothetical protein PRVXH_001824 [Proteinivorax hydrogeniformans]|uniref:Uncharacterized protein n=1 Tax=Proteinivorax hydrogeniformans TaxID=1826727 RepID=A0AAU8HQU7_9FIRM
MGISRNKSQFIEDMVQFKEKAEEVLNRSIGTSELTEARKGYEGKISAERFKSYLVTKTAIHLTCQYIHIRLASEASDLISPKFNIEAIELWGELSRNYREDYYELYRLACKDLRRAESTRNLYTGNTFDKYVEKLKIGFFITNQDNPIEKLKKYDFATLDPDTAIALFERIYPIDSRRDIKDFIEESKVTTELMNQLGLA